MSKVYLITAIAEFDEKMVEDEGEELITLLNKSGIYGIEAITPYESIKNAELLSYNETVAAHRQHLRKVEDSFNASERISHEAELALTKYFNYDFLKGTSWSRESTEIYLPLMSPKSKTGLD